MGNELDSKVEFPIAKTLGTHIGEMVWLLNQSIIHRPLAIQDMDWFLFPPVVLGQYKMFREEGRPIGFALWAYLNEEAETRLKASGKLHPQDWGNQAHLDQTLGLVRNPGGTLWLVELVAPYHTESSKHREQMLNDLCTTVLSDQPLKLLHINPETKKREELTLNTQR